VKLTPEERVERLLSGRDEPRDVYALDKLSVGGRLIVTQIIEIARTSSLRIRQLEVQIQTLKRRQYKDSIFTADELGMEVDLD